MILKIYTILNPFCLLKLYVGEAELLSSEGESGYIKMTFVGIHKAGKRNSVGFKMFSKHSQERNFEKRSVMYIVIFYCVRVHIMTPHTHNSNHISCATIIILPALHGQQSASSYLASFSPPNKTVR